MARSNTINLVDSRRNQPNTMVKLKEMFFVCLSNWKWFLLSLILFLGAAFYYLRVTPKVYTSSASILIKSDDKKGNAEDQLKELGIMQSASNVTNEILSLQTSSVAAEIVDRLNLEVSYFQDGPFHKEDVYGVKLPVEVEFLGLNDNEEASLDLILNADSTIILSNFHLNGKPIESRPLKMCLGNTVKTPIGNLSVNSSPYYVQDASVAIEVVRRKLADAVKSVNRNIEAALRDKNSTIIDVTYRDTSIPRAEDVLNTLVAVYNENWVKDRNQVTASTSDFIKERLNVIERELGNVDENISTYKSENLVPDVQQVSNMAMLQANEAEQQSRVINNQLYMTRYVRNYLTDGMHDNQQLPSNSGIDNPGIEQQINEYNSLLLQRNNHLAVSSAQNPLVMDLDQKLSSMKNTIINSLDNELTMLNAHQRTVRASHGQATARIAANPEQAKYLLSVERQQKVKESLYLFLLQKREENELSQAFTAYNTRLIEAPHTDDVPTTPNSRNIYLAAVFLALLIPGTVIIAKENLNTAVRGRKDLESLNVPFVGEIPQHKSKHKSKKDKKNAPNLSTEVVVVEKSRNVMNEAFRVVRTNLEFVLGFDNNHKVIMLTSMNPGSGKTFITANLSSALGIKNKKVLAIDLDLRKGSLSEYVGKPSQGLSNYLSGQTLDYGSLIVPLGTIDVLPCGTIPPNPTELLFSPRFKTMIDEVKQRYDYVFLDCPPAEIVADASIISRYVDMTLFIIRAGLMDRSFLSDIEKWYDEKKFTNLSIILNGTSEGFSHYGYHKYGYRYGYHYGSYGYGYGYGKTDE